MVKIKGNEIELPVIRDHFDRRAVQIENRIMGRLKLLGVERDDVDLVMERNARLKARASVSWYFEGKNLNYSYSLCDKFIENLYAVDKVLEIEIDKLLDEEITLDEFHREFSEDDSLPKELIEARKTLGVADDEDDYDLISEKYKALAKKFHPDMAEGDHEM